ncbi:3-phosphoshikimate 1-carboxyvinyltransferase [Ornithinibacillus halotolerans]|uniref:3-phosphoshikimate 1-carboxyvinyltransferase n=1 Tax=Ornithinibacillus halotolerans TaxID=1274357 RepID=A0A916W2P6_9BACI|nr:3-phosphoshikimate 1-carboxyvinyltransferase [Ornithinibacillus halotolerans]GGA61346.1 3-phosphoshikimate 1-carboxyvinyltransferase [Ornithinibacillus halotolerans]
MEILKSYESVRIYGEIEVPGDKSISHRSVMLGAIAEGITKVDNFLDGEDCIRTVEAFRAMGVAIENQGNTLLIDGKGIEGLLEPVKPIYFGNSGTSARLMLGLLAGLPFSTFMYGDESLTYRPMSRVMKPLSEMGATFIGRSGGDYLPIALEGTSLTGITYPLPVKSAQVKSAILLAGLHAKGKTTVIEKSKTRDHTEKMLQAFGANIRVDGNTIEIDSSHPLKATNLFIPGDISSAAFLLTAAAIIPDSTLTIKNVGLNQTRTGILNILEKMGASLEFTNEQSIGGEPIGDITIHYRPLRAITIEGDMIPSLIDEIPIIALLATQAKGTTIIRDAEELRVKETDRIHAVVDVLSSLGATIEETNDGMIIKGKAKLHGGTVSSYNDHRIAMMAVVASLITENAVTIDDLSSIAISYPSFMKDLSKLLINN